jgi:hypothetical protein
MVGTSLLVAASFYATLPSTTAGATAITATAVVIAAFKAEVSAAEPDAEVGARSAVPSRPASPRAGAASSAFIFLAVSAVLLITLFAGGWHAIRYYAWEPPNVHHGGPGRSPGEDSSKTPSTVGRDVSGLIAGQGGSLGEISALAYNTRWALRRLEVRVGAQVTTLITWSEPRRLSQK